MANKTINTRIELKYDSLENWNSSTLILGSGEVAIVEIPSNNTTEGFNEAGIALKVGDGSKTFSELSYLQAIAGDVHAWAKTDNLKDAVLTGYVKTSDTGAIVATDTLQKAISKLENEIAKLSGDVEAVPDTNTTYVITTGAANGTIKVTPSEGEAYEVEIKGFSETFGSVKYENSTLKFYHTSDDTEALTEISLPKEQFIDTTKTVFVNTFAWSEASYPGSTNPNLDNKPVLVLALKDETDVVNYSFLDMNYLVNIYTGVDTDTVKMTVGTDNTIKGEIKIATDADNAVTKKETGIYSKIQSSDNSVSTSTSDGTTDIKLTSVSTDLLSQGVDTIIFDCGGANV